MRLLDLQQAIAERVLDRSPDRRDGELLDHIDGLGLAPSQRLQIYRNNCLISLTEALKATFPVTRRLVGDGFFRTAAAAFISDHPPREPRLAAYGATFADFIKHYPPAASLAYLPDMARLEWALNRAWHAPDTPALTPADLAQAAEAMPVLHLHPACGLLVSPWPIEKIWRVHQSDDDTDVRIDLREGGSRLLVYRQGFDVAMAAISRGELVMLASLATGATLEAALTEALEADPALDVAAALAAALTRGCLIREAAETGRQA